MGKEHPDYLTTLSNIASNYSDIGDYNKALELNLECLKIKEKVFGKENPSYLITIGNLSANYSNLGNFSKALELNLECLKIKEKILGKESPDYLLTLGNIAYNYSDLGDYNKALELNLECLKIKEKIFGKENPAYLTTLGNIASNFSHLGDYNKALELNLECLKIKEKVIGKENPSYLITIGNLAVNYSDLGNFSRALEVNLECLKIKEKMFGKEHPDYLLTLGNSATNYSDLGNYAKSIELNLECLKKTEKIYGKLHPYYLSTLNNLSLNYVKLDDLQKALVLSIECLISKEKTIGKEHPDYLLTLSNLAAIYNDLGQYNLAIEINSKCLISLEKLFGKEHPGYLTTLGNLAVNYGDLGNYEKALEINQECLRIKGKILGEKNPDYLTTLINLSADYLYLGNHDKALELTKKCLKITTEIYGVENEYYLTNLNNLASIYHSLKNFQKSLELNSECVKLSELVFGKEHSNYARALNNLSLLYRDSGDYQKALELNLQSLKINEKIFSIDHNRYLTSLSNTSFSYLDLKEYKFTDSLKILENFILEKLISKKLIGLNIEMQEFSKLKLFSKFILFQNYTIFRKTNKRLLQQNAFNSWLNFNGIISIQSAQLEPQIRASKDSSLIQLFEKWQLNKLQLLKYYELTKPELEKRGINIAVLEEEINEQERALSRGSEVFSEMKKTYALSDIQQQLKEDEAYVDIVRLPYYNFNTNVWSDTIRYLAYIITKDTKEIPTTVLLENGNQLEEEIASYFAENTFGNSKREKDSISYAYYWKPIYKELSGKKKIYLSSGGVYNNINIQTLFNPSTNKYVSEEMEVQLVNNGRTFIQQKTKKPQQYSNNTATFIGYPNFNGTLSNGSINEDAIYATSREFSPMLLDTLSRGANVSPLPGTKKEVETIGQLLKNKQWNVNLFTENNASEEEIKKVESPRVLHIATHGYFLKQTDNLQKESGLRMMGMDTKRFVENPLLRSGLLLSGANKTLKGDTTRASENGILTAYEAAYLHLQGTELVVLSACETGKGELKNGEGVYGLRKSFADAGAKNIIMSLWKVDDKVTQEFMTSFYTNWSTGITIREAFNKTQQSIKAMYPQPYYWGAFILVGE